MTKFLREPPSIKGAAGTVVTATFVVVVISGIGMRLFDHTEYSNVFVGMWWALQTVTTVGYGDVTPVKPVGRIIASFVMLEGIAFLAIVTAAITDTTIENLVEASNDDIALRLDRIETLLRELGKPD
jgi:voltage-gated potassium channel Kch